MKNPDDVFPLRLMLVDQIIKTRYGGKKKDFADATDIDSTIVSRWFMKGAGHKNIGEDIARRIELSLKLSPGSLVMPDRATAEQALIQGEAIGPNALTAEEREMLLAFRALEKANRQKTIGYMAALHELERSSRAQSRAPDSHAAAVKKRGVS